TGRNLVRAARLPADVQAKPCLPRGDRHWPDRPRGRFAAQYVMPVIAPALTASQGRAQAVLSAPPLRPSAAHLPSARPGTRQAAEQESSAASALAAAPWA